jgi:hypothetical protein
MLVTTAQMLGSEVNLNGQAPSAGNGTTAKTFLSLVPTSANLENSATASC